LNTKTGVKNAVDDTLTEKAWLSSVKATWSLQNATPGAGIGPILVGVAHSDYTLTEIEEWIENLQSWEEGDKRQQEVARRKIRRVGILGTGANLADMITLNDGKPVHTKCGWQLATGQTVALWYYNAGTAAFATTTPTVATEGHANLWPN